MRASPDNSPPQPARLVRRLAAAGLLLTAAVSAQEQAASPRDVPPPPARTIRVPEGKLPGYDELPLDIRREHDRPHLEVHYYDPDPDKRFAMINGFRGSEGMPMGRELWVHEIRANGVVMRVQDRFFFIKP